MSPLRPRRESRRLRETEHGSSGPAPLATDRRVGTRLAAYQIEELVGRGGMGVVYRAEHLHLRRSVALKLLDPELADDASFRERFLRESRIAAGIHHPNIVTIYDAGEADGLLYIAMRFVQGTNLADVLEDEGALEPSRALAIVSQIAQALDAAHALGVVHRDVKPGNVLIEGERCYLTDFGLTRHISSKTGLTAKGQFVGTIDYMPPEQIESGAVDGRSDVYSLGCLLYHALAGSVPYEKDSDVSVIYAHLQERPPSLLAKSHGLPDALDAVIAKALAKRKEDRYARCSELVAAARAAFAAPAEDSPPAAPRVPANVRKVLVADDEPRIRAMVRVSLGERFEVLEAGDAETALALARDARPELAFVGWELPDRAGAEVCRALRADGDTAPMKIVAMASRGDAAGDAELLSAGADDYLRKPFPSVQLLYKVSALLAPARGSDGEARLADLQSTTGGPR